MTYENSRKFAIWSGDILLGFALIVTSMCFHMKSVIAEENLVEKAGVNIHEMLETVDLFLKDSRIDILDHPGKILVKSTAQNLEITRCYLESLRSSQKKEFFDRVTRAYSVEFSNASLEAVIEILEALTKIDIETEVGAAQDLGLSEHYDWTGGINMKVKSMPFKEILEISLQFVDKRLVFRIEDEKVIVTNEARLIKSLQNYIIDEDPIHKAKQSYTDHEPVSGHKKRMRDALNWGHDFRAEQWSLREALDALVALAGPNTIIDVNVVSDETFDQKKY